MLYAIDIAESQVKVRDFLSTRRYSFPVLFDQTGSVSDAYGVTSTPATFFIGTDGIIKKKFPGPFPNLRSIETQLKSIMP